MGVLIALWAYIFIYLMADVARWSRLDLIQIAILHKLNLTALSNKIKATPVIFALQ